MRSHKKGLLNSELAMAQEVVPLKEVREQVEVAITRLALLHLSFAKTLVQELGERKGKELAVKSILEYGRRVGERTKTRTT